MIKESLEAQRKFYSQGNTRDVESRIILLKKLKKVIERRELDIEKALYADFNKPAMEAYLSEIFVVIQELNLFIKNLKSWSKPKSVRASFFNFPSSAKIYKEPYGQSLIISPWNYPFQLAISPLIGAVGAGNTAIVKPSELTPHTTNLLEEIIEEVFDQNWVKVIKGDKEVAQKLLSQKWDYIFFTGSTKVGKIVAKAAAENLTPTTLELGGKNPTIVHESAKIGLSAKRIAWAKFLNAGQTCIAPDYLIVHESIHKELIEELQKSIAEFYGGDIDDNSDFASVVNNKNQERLAEMLDDGTVITGGTTGKNNHIAPTLLLNPSLESKVMEGEIFGPILPILTYKKEDEIGDIILRYPKPLSLYVYADDQAFAKAQIEKFSFGGGAINDSIIHFVNHRLPFGGVGNSGLGSYHGRKSFETFSHQKSVVKRGTWLDLPMRYPPYEGKLSKIKKLAKWL